MGRGSDKQNSTTKATNASKETYFVAFFAFVVKE
jgi:hypothetical protein